MPILFAMHLRTNNKRILSLSRSQVSFVLLFVCTESNHHFGAQRLENAHLCCSHVYLWQWWWWWQHIYDVCMMSIEWICVPLGVLAGRVYIYVGGLLGEEEAWRPYATWRWWWFGKLRQEGYKLDYYMLYGGLWFNAWSLQNCGKKARINYIVKSQVAFRIILHYIRI